VIDRRTPIIEQDGIGDRMRELAAERMGWALCTCSGVVDQHGHKALSLSPTCPIHSGDRGE
jgi:hypothetical protein